MIISPDFSEPASQEQLLHSVRNSLEAAARYALAFTDRRGYYQYDQEKETEDGVEITLTIHLSPHIAST